MTTTRKILSIFLVISMVFFTIGFQLHYHTCGKTYHYTYNIMSTPDCACELDMEGIDDACCEMDKNINLQKVLGNDDITHTLLDSDCCENNLIDLEISQIFLFSVHKNPLKVVVVNDFMYELYSIINIDDIQSTLITNNLSKVLPKDIIRHILRVSHLFSRSDNSNDLYVALI